MRAAVPAILACLVLLPAIHCSVARCEDPQRVLYDGFSDGDIHTNPSWESGDLNWYNPFFVEKFNGRSWAGAKRYGSFGSWFYTPDTRNWPTPISASENPITVSFLAFFRPSTTNDALNFSLIGDQSRVAVKFTTRGNLQYFFQATGKGKEPERGLQRVVDIPRIPKGKATHIACVFGGKNTFEFRINNQTAYRLPESERKKVGTFLTPFDRLAFLGPWKVSEPNVHLLVPSLQDTRAFHWVTNIEVWASPEKLTHLPSVPLEAKPKSCLILRGLSGFNIDLVKRLRARGWDATGVYAHYPLRGKDATTFRNHLAAEELAKYEWVVLFDVHAMTIGLRGCHALRNYVAGGGKLLIAGGTSGLARGWYFESPLAACLPVRGGDVPGGLLEITPATHAQFAHFQTDLPGTRRICGHIPILEKRTGKGVVRVLPWAFIGNPRKPFWEHKSWLMESLSPLPKG